MSKVRNASVRTGLQYVVDASKKKISFLSGWDRGKKNGLDMSIVPSKSVYKLMHSSLTADTFSVFDARQANCLLAR
jgi:hypothetical protein